MWKIKKNLFRKKSIDLQIIKKTRSRKCIRVKKKNNAFNLWLCNISAKSLVLGYYAANRATDDTWYCNVEWCFSWYFARKSLPCRYFALSLQSETDERWTLSQLTAFPAKVGQEKLRCRFAVGSLRDRLRKRSSYWGKKNKLRSKCWRWEFMIWAGSASKLSRHYRM